MARTRNSRSPTTGKAARRARDDLLLTLWAERKFADENEAVFRAPYTKITQGGNLLLPQDLRSFYPENEVDVEFRKKSPEQLAKQRPFEDIRTALAILLTRVVSTKISPLRGAVRLPLSYGYLVGERSRSGDGYRFEQALAPYYQDGFVPETREKNGDPQFPGNPEVFTNMTERPSYYMWRADMGAIRQNFEDIRKLLDGSFWIDLGSHNGKKLREIWKIGKEYEKETAKPFAPAMHVINDISPLRAAHKELLETGISPEKIMELPGDFESAKFWKEVCAAHQEACAKAVARGEVPPKLVITELGGTAGNRGPDGLKRQLRTMRRELPCAFTYLASIDGTGTDLRPEDVADPDSKDLHGKAPKEIKKIEALGRVRLIAAYDIPETKHFHHMSAYKILHLTRMIDDPCDLTARVYVHYPRPHEPNISAIEFGATNHGRKETKIYLPRDRRNKEPNGKYKPARPLISILEDLFEILSEQLTKIGRAHTKDLFREAGTEAVKRLGYTDEGQYPGVNHGLYQASYAEPVTPQPSPAGRSSLPAYQG